MSDLVELDDIDRLMLRKQPAARTEAERTSKMLKMLGFCSKQLQAEFSAEDLKIFQQSIVLLAKRRHEKATQTLYFWSDKELVSDWVNKNGY